MVDLILAFTVLEATVLGLWRRQRSRVIAGYGAGTRDFASAAPDRDRASRLTLEARSASPRPRLAQYRDIGLMLLPGIFLLVALRVALAGAAWPWVPLALIAALVAHLLDLRQRWRG
jgi:hypothetical protein